MDGAESFISEQGVDIWVIPPESKFAPLVQCHECSLLDQTPIKQLQQTQILAPPQPISLPPISTLPGYPLYHGKDSEEDEPQPEQEPEPEQHEPKPELQEPDPEKQSELET